MIPHEMTTSAFEIPGFRISRSLGIVRGIVVRSRSVPGSIGASLQTLVGVIEVLCYGTAVQLQNNC